VEQLVPRTCRSCVRSRRRPDSGRLAPGRVSPAGDPPCWERRCSAGGTAGGERAEMRRMWPSGAASGGENARRSVREMTSFRKRPGQRRVEGRAWPPPVTGDRVPRLLRSTNAGGRSFPVTPRGPRWHPRPRPRRGRQRGRLSGVLTAATGAVSGRRWRPRGKKGPAALALAVGVVGVAVAKRRRSAGANEPLERAYPVDAETPSAPAGTAGSAEAASEAGKAG
jgi:hypothetical protein